MLFLMMFNDFDMFCNLLVFYMCFKCILSILIIDQEATDEAKKTAPGTAAAGTGGDRTAPGTAAAGTGGEDKDFLSVL